MKSRAKILWVSNIPNANIMAITAVFAPRAHSTTSWRRWAMNSWIPYGRQTIEEDDIQEVVNIPRSDWLTTGPMVERFEKPLVDTVGARFAVTSSAGTAAPRRAYSSAGVGPGDAAITSPLTCAATADAAVFLGATPVFAAVQEDTGNLVPAHVRRLLTRRTKALAPVDYAGHPAD